MAIKTKIRRSESTLRFEPGMSWRLACSHDVIRMNRCEGNYPQLASLEFKITIRTVRDKSAFIGLLRLLSVGKHSFRPSDEVWDVRKIGVTAVVLTPGQLSFEQSTVDWRHLLGLVVIASAERARP